MTSHDLLSCDTISGIVLPGARIDSALSLDQVADPDYLNHPAYGRAFPPASVWARPKATFHLLPWLAFAMVKQILLGDRI